jgi:hypothetical protein
VLSTILVSIVAQSWSVFDRAAVQMLARAELVREADLAVTRLADDLRRVNTTGVGNYVRWAYDEDIRQFDLTVPNGATTESITYAVIEGVLVRQVDPPSGPSEPVAWNALDLEVRPAALPTVAGQPGLYEVILRMGRGSVSENRRTGQALEREFRLLTVLP